MPDVRRSGAGRRASSGDAPRRQRLAVVDWVDTRDCRDLGVASGRTKTSTDDARRALNRDRVVNAVVVRAKDGSHWWISHVRCESGRPGAERPTDLPLVPGGVLDPAEPPAMLIPDRRQLRRTRGACLRDEVVRVVDHKQHSAGRAAIRTRTRAIRGCARDPVTGVPHGQLGHDIVAVADTVQHGRPERGLIEGDRVARARPKVQARCSS